MYLKNKVKLNTKQNLKVHLRHPDNYNIYTYFLI